jgi:hypothetical protein
MEPRAKFSSRYSYKDVEVVVDNNTYTVRYRKEINNISTDPNALFESYDLDDVLYKGVSVYDLLEKTCIKTITGRYVGTIDNLRIEAAIALSAWCFSLGGPLDE